MSTEELRRLAGAATPGHWVAQSRDDGKSDPWYIDTHANPEGPEPVWAPPQYPVSEADAAYIAAASPDTLLRLLDRIDALQEALTGLVACTDGWDPVLDPNSTWAAAIAKARSTLSETS